MTAAFAVVMNRLIEQSSWLAEAIELDKARVLKKNDVDQHAHNPLWVDRTTRDVDNRSIDAFVFQALLNSDSS